MTVGQFSHYNWRWLVDKSREELWRATAAGSYGIPQIIKKL